MHSGKTVLRVCKHPRNSRPFIEFLCDSCAVSLRGVFHAGALWQALPNQSVGVLIHSVFSGVMRRDETEVHRQHCFKSCVAVEFGRNCVHVSRLCLNQGACTRIKGGAGSPGSVAGLVEIRVVPPYSSVDPGKHSRSHRDDTTHATITKGINGAPVSEHRAHPGCAGN